jgi:Na+/H+ antiporter subunit
VTEALLALGVGAELLCCAGVLVMRGAEDRLHYTGAGAVLPPMLIAAAVVLEEWFSASSITAILVAFVLVALNTILVIATARVARGLDP